MADMIFYISKSKDDCKKRFMTRDADGLTVEQNTMKANYFDTVVWHAHERYVDKYVKDYALDDKFFKLPGYGYSKYYRK